MKKFWLAAVLVVGCRTTVPIDWTAYGHDAAGTRHSPAAQITPDNVSKLEVAWVYRTGDYGVGESAARFENTPLLVDGTLFLTTPFGRVIALRQGGAAANLNDRAQHLTRDVQAAVARKNQRARRTCFDRRSMDDRRAVHRKIDQLTRDFRELHGDGGGGVALRATTFAARGHGSCSLNVGRTLARGVGVKSDPHVVTCRALRELNIPGIPMSNRHWSFIPLSFFVLLTGPGWSAVDPKTTPQIKATLLQVKSVALNPTSITGGGTVNGVVTISAAPAQGVTVKIVSSAPQTVEVPQSVVIQPSATSATFIAQTHPVVVNPNVAAPPPSVQISAQIGNLPPTVATLTVLPPTLTALTLNPVIVGGGANATGTVTISGPAPSGGLLITLASPTSSTSSQRALTGIARIPSGISMPSQVTISAAATSGSFTITTRPVSAPTTFHVDASLGVFVTKTAILTVTAPDVANVKLCRGQLPSSTPCTGEYTDQLYSGGMPWTGTVNLTAPAPAEGLTIALKTFRASGGTTGTFAQCGEVPSVPSTVTVPGGAASANFTVTTYPGYGEYWVEASSTTKSANTLSVDSPGFRPAVPSTAKGGTAVQGKIQLTGPAMAANCGNRYSLASSNTNFAQVPAYVDLTPGTSEGTFPITTSALPASSAPVTVTISVTGTYVTGGAANAGKATLTVNLTITP